VISSAIAYGILTTFAWLLSLGWLWNLLEWLRNFPRAEDLNQITLPALAEPCLILDSANPAPPHLTVIVPACNEAPSIAATLHSLLASTGIRLQILAVNDRSTDQTGQLMEEVLAEWQSKSLNQTPKHTLEIIHIKYLLLGWLGKPHALAIAARLARADWIVFTDGDVLFGPGRQI
jgi:cellulose synthase/poly-beta-1,6-N-acetylglucosamine synthase-like glycosyltransferase